MGEYGNAIGNGPAGQVSAGHGGSTVVGGGDPFGGFGNAVNNVTHWLGTLSPIELVLLIVAIFIGLMIFRRAF